MNAPTRSRPVDIVTWIAEIVEEVFAPLESLRHDFDACHRSAVAHGERLNCDHITSMRPAVLHWLRREHGLAVGAGVIVAPGLLADRPRRLEWWSRPPDGHDPVFLDVDLDPKSLEFYDYARAEWFREPRVTGRRHITGPHVDFGGTDRYIITFTLPVFSRNRFLGVVGADVLTARLEARLLPVLVGLDYEVVLLNAERRVIAANSPHLPSGTLCTELADTDHTLPDSPWRLLCSPRAGQRGETGSTPRRPAPTR